MLRRKAANPAESKRFALSRSTASPTTGRLVLHIEAMWHLALDTTITPASAGRPAVILLPPDSTVKIGRLAEVALYEPAGAPDYAKSLTSRLHAEITNGADGPVIFDRSQNGTQVDGVGLAKDASRGAD